MHPDQQSQALARQLGQQTLMPQRRAFRTWRKIGAVGRAWVAEAHRQQRDLIGVVKRCFGDPEPFPEPLAAVVLPRHAAGMNLRSGRLPDDDQPCPSAQLNNGTWARRQLGDARGATPDVGEKLSERRCHFLALGGHLAGSMIAIT